MKLFGKLLAASGVQLVGYALGTIGAMVMVPSAFLGLWGYAAAGLVVLILGAFVTIRGEDLEP